MTTYLNSHSHLTHIIQTLQILHIPCAQKLIDNAALDYGSLLFTEPLLWSYHG